MNKIETTPIISIGKTYEYDESQIMISEGILKKRIDTINFVDIKDIKTTKSIFGWGKIIIIDINGPVTLNYVSDPLAVHKQLNQIFLEHKNKMKKVDVS